MQTGGLWGGREPPPDLNPKFPKNVTVTTTPTAGL